ncbi:DUF4388 domain-containing protein [bacterium]|nr:DUF4388 domain-containing protein [bacterium]
MFGRGQQQPGKIRLPKQNTFPDFNVLRGVYEQAQVNRGQEIELNWAIPGSLKSYSIFVKFDKVTSTPQWQVWEDDGRQSKLVSRFETADLNLILDVIMMLETQSHHQPRSTGTFQAMTNPAMGTGSGSYNAAASSGVQPGRPGTSPTAGFPTTSGVYPQPSMQGQQATQGPQGYAQPQSQSIMGGATLPPMPGSSPRASSVSLPALGNQSYGGTPLSNNRQQPGNNNLPEGSLPADFFSNSSALPGASSGPAQNAALEGSLDRAKVSDILSTYGMSRLTGMLEVLGDNAIGQVFFVEGVPKHAQAGTARGDAAVKELVTWRKGTYSFKPNKLTDMNSCDKSLQASITEGTALLNQMKALEEAGLVYESYLVLKQKNLSDTELKLMLSKGQPLDFEWQKSIYELLKRKRTFTDLLRDQPMESSQWAPLLFNFLYCGIMEIKAPSGSRGGALDFLGDGKQVIQALKYNFIRPDTGIFSLEGILYFLEYEFYRFEAYNLPLSLIIMELAKRRGEGSMQAEALPPEIIAQASMRIDLVKRPLDTLGHFEGTEFALILPNTKPSQAAFIANRILDSVSNTPLANDINKRNLLIAIGIAGLPSDGEDLPALIGAARSAKNEALQGTFPIVLSRSLKRD